MSSSTRPAAGIADVRRAWASAVGTRLRSGIGLNLTAAVFNQGSTFAVNLVVANLLGRERFGEYTMVLATVATVGTLGQLSMGYTATKFLAEYRSVDPARASRILGLGAATAVVAAPVAASALALPADLLAARVLGAPHLADDLVLAAAAVLFIVLNGFAIGALAGLESYRAIARAGIASGTIYFLLCSPLAWRYGLEGALAGVALSAAAQFAILLALLRREAARQGLAVAWQGLWTERRIVTGFALPASATGLLTLPAVWWASAILARQPSGYDHLALFGAASSFRTMVLFLPQTMNNVGMAVLNHERAASSERYARVFWMNAALTAAAATAAAVAAAVAGPWLLRMFGRGFAEGYPVLIILVGTAVLEAVALAAYQAVVTQGRMWLSFLLVALPRDGSLVLAAFVLAPALGATGLASAHLTAQAIGLVCVLAIVARLGLGARERVVGANRMTRLRRRRNE